MHPLLRFTLDLFESSPVVATPPERVKSVPLKPAAEREPHQPGPTYRLTMHDAHSLGLIQLSHRQVTQ